MNLPTLRAPIGRVLSCNRVQHWLRLTAVRDVTPPPGPGYATDNYRSYQIFILYVKYGTMNKSKEHFIWHWPCYPTLRYKDKQVLLYTTYYVQ